MKSIIYFGMVGKGRTLTEAKRNAGSRIEAAIKSSYSPTILEWRGHAGLVWHEPEGWCLKIFMINRGVTNGTLYAPPRYQKEHHAIRALRLSLAIIGTQSGEMDVPSILGNDRDLIHEWDLARKPKEPSHEKEVREPCLP